MKFLATLTGLLLAAHAARAGCTLNSLPARGYGGQFAAATYGGTVAYQQPVLAPACPSCDDQAQLGALLARLQQPTYGAGYALPTYVAPVLAAPAYRTYLPAVPVQRMEFRGFAETGYGLPRGFGGGYGGRAVPVPVPIPVGGPRRGPLGGAFAGAFQPGGGGLLGIAERVVGIGDGSGQLAQGLLLGRFLPGGGGLRFKK